MRRSVACAPAWALASVTALTSLAAHRLGGGALPSGGQWVLPLLAFAAVWLIVRPMTLTSRSVGALLVVGQALGHVALELAVPHRMAGGMSSGGSVVMDASSMHGAMVGSTGLTSASMTGMGATRAMLVAHLVGSLGAWMIAHLLLRVAGAGRARWDALTGRMVLPRLVIRQRRVAVRRERASLIRAFWSVVAPRRGPPVTSLLAA